MSGRHTVVCFVAPHPEFRDSHRFADTVPGQALPDILDFTQYPWAVTTPPGFEYVVTVEVHPVEVVPGMRFDVAQYIIQEISAIHLEVQPSWKRFRRHSAKEYHCLIVHGVHRFPCHRQCPCVFFPVVSPAAAQPIPYFQVIAVGLVVELPVGYLGLRGTVDYAVTVPVSISVIPLRQSCRELRELLQPHQVDGTAYGRCGPARIPEDQHDGRQPKLLQRRVVLVRLRPVIVVRRRVERLCPIPPHTGSGPFGSQIRYQVGPVSEFKPKPDPERQLIGADHCCEQHKQQAANHAL